jgi:hypothetical protein
MTLTNAGNVGIGTSSPSYKLDVNGTGRFQFRNSSDEIMDLAISTETFQSKSKISLNWYGNETASIKFNRGGDASGGNIELWTKPDAGVGGDIAQRVTVRSNGNVGIGTSSPAVQLNVGHESHGVGIAYTSSLPNSAGIYTSSDGAHGQAYGSLIVQARADYSGYGICFRASNAERMRIDGNGNVGIGTSSPIYPLHVAGNSFLGGRVSSFEIINQAIGGDAWVVAFEVPTATAWKVWCGYTRSDPDISTFTTFDVFRSPSGKTAATTPVQVDDAGGFVRLRINGNNVEFFRSLSTGGGNRQVSVTAIRIY